MAASAAFFFQQDSHPVVPVVLANASLLTGVVMLHGGLLRFYGLPPWPRSWVIAAIFAISGVLSWYSIMEPNFVLRVILMATVNLALFGRLCWLPLRYGKGSLGSLLTALAFGLTSTACFVRLTSILTSLDRPESILEPGILQAVYLGSFMVSILMGTIGFILLVNERLRDILEFSASHDALTGVLNRGAFFSRAHDVFTTSRRQGRPLSAALLDLDHFKQINDGHGHAVGDHVLQDFCHSVRKVLRPTDIMGRYGGEEFVLLLPGMTCEESAALGQRVRQALQPHPGLPPYTVSIGVAAMGPGTASVDELLNAADKALYYAKSRGRDRVEAAAQSGDRVDAAA